MRENSLVSNYTVAHYKVHKTKSNDADIPNLVDRDFDKVQKLYIVQKRRKNMKIGVIGSTGLNIKMFTKIYEFKQVLVGQQVVNYYEGTVGDNTIFLLARNLYEAPCPPHLVQYELIINALEKLGVEVIIGTAVVGSLNYDIKPREYVVLDQFIDFTKRTPFTTFTKERFAFVDYTKPYCEEVRKILIEACKAQNISYHSSGCYVGVDGPRYETAAEVKAYGMLGGDVVGMTNVTEAIFAREKGICYAALAIVSNYGAGMDKQEILRQDCYDETMAVVDYTAIIVKEAILRMKDKEICNCREKIVDMIQ